MALQTYADLSASLAGWLNRTDLTARIPDFITLCEAEIRRILRPEGDRVQIDFTLDAGADLTPLTGALELEDVALNTTGSDGRLSIVTFTDLMWFRTNQYSAAGIPVKICLFNGQIMTAPIPDTAYTMRVMAQMALVPLTTGPDTNWVLTNHADVYLYGSLIHSAPYLGDDDRVATWQALFDRARDQLDFAKERAAFGARPVARPRRAIG